MKKLSTIVFVLLFYYQANLPLFSCTSIYIIRDSIILAGKNQDFGEWRTMLGFFPSNAHSLAKAYFGGKGVFPTGGINSSGLIFELHQGEFPKQMLITPGKLVFAGNLIDKIMSECNNVEEVRDTLKKYTSSFLFNQNIAFGDKLGRSIIVEGDTIIERIGDYQICTNFYQSIHDRRNAPCWRYKNVDEKIKNESKLSISLIKEALKSAQNNIFTQYSVIYDIKKGLIYVFFYHDFDQVKVFDLKTEWNLGEHLYKLPDLFPGNKAYTDIYVNRQAPQNNASIRTFLILFVLGSIISLILLFISGSSVKMRKFYSRITLFSRLLLGISAFLSLIYLARFLGDPESFQIGILPPSIHFYSSLGHLVLLIPKLLIIFGSLLIISVLINWKNNFFPLKMKIYYSLYSSLLLVLLLLFNYWNFI